LSRVRVKVCGIVGAEDALMATKLGVDALGFNFWTRSPRYVKPETARIAVSIVPPVVCCIGVFVNESADEIRAIVDSVGLGAVQLHGDETPEFCEQLRPTRVIKAFRVGADFQPEIIQRYDVSAVLLDGDAKEKYGGTGKTFDWQKAVEAGKYAQIILAGGLTIKNVADAILHVRPLGVDVCSGLESEPGKKDPDKMVAFMAEIDRVSRQLALGASGNGGPAHGTNNVES
jgi:phosphoribosylanthranilate isomerase